MSRKHKNASNSGDEGHQRKKPKKSVKGQVAEAIKNTEQKQAPVSPRKLKRRRAFTGEPPTLPSENPQQNTHEEPKTSENPQQDTHEEPKTSEKPQQNTRRKPRRLTRSTFQEKSRKRKVSTKESFPLPPEEDLPSNESVLEKMKEQRQYLLKSPPKTQQKTNKKSNKFETISLEEILKDQKRDPDRKPNPQPRRTRSQTEFEKLFNEASRNNFNPPEKEYSQGCYDDETLNKFLRYAAKINDKTSIETLLNDHIVSPGSKDSFRQNAFQIATQQGSKDAVEALKQYANDRIDSDIPIEENSLRIAILNSKDTDEVLFLFEAADTENIKKSFKNEDIFNLQKKCMHPDKKERKKPLQTMKLLVKESPLNFDDILNDDQNTLLTVCAIADDKKNVKLLLEQGKRHDGITLTIDTEQHRGLLENKNVKDDIKALLKPNLTIAPSPSKLRITTSMNLRSNSQESEGSEL